MKKLFLIPVAMLLIVGALAACDEESTKIQGDSDTKATAQSNSSESEQKEKDIWTYYNGTTWSDNYKGLKTTIEKAVVSDKAPKEDGSDGTSSAVGVKFKLENTTKDKFTTYPDQAVLVTSTGEQIDAPTMFGTDDLGGEIDEGVTKEGQVIWYLKKEAKDVKWIKLKWSAYQGEEMGDGMMNTKEYEVKLDLKK